jgi:aromatase
MDFRTLPGSTHNSIVILKSFNFVFEKTNDLRSWPQLFTEYESVEILEETETEVRFRLKTFAEGARPSRSWMSTRKIDRARCHVHGQREPQSFPFSNMDIFWDYEVLPGDIGVVMTWRQEFEVMGGSPLSKFEMEAFLNRSSVTQMAHIKQVLEQWPANA